MTGGASRYHYIDGLRAIAVLSVVVFHSLVGEGTFHNVALPAIQNMGARGVDLFFVLSGFCLSLPYLKEARESGSLKIDFGVFLSRRLARITPPYYVALVIFTILAATPFGYPSTWAPSVAALDGAGPREFFADLFFLTTRQPVANGAFWTLGIEMRWYLVCPLVIALYVRSRVAFAALLVAAYALYYVPQQHILDFGTLPAFMLGVVAADLSLRPSRMRAPFAIATILVLVATIYEQAVNDAVNHADPLWHVTFFALVVASRTPFVMRALASRPLVFIGTASYSVYLIHLPIIDWFESIGATPLLAGAIGILLGIVFWALVERPLVATVPREALASGIRRFFRRYARAPIIVRCAEFDS